MNRNEEYKALRESLEQTPSQLVDTVDRALKKMCIRDSGNIPLFAQQLRQQHAAAGGAPKGVVAQACLLYTSRCV